jgi:hypothetical protein
MGDSDYQKALVLRKEGKYKEGRLLLESAFKKGCMIAGYELKIAYMYGGWDVWLNELKEREMHELLRKQNSLYVIFRSEQTALDSNDPFLCFLFYSNTIWGEMTQCIKFARLAAEQGNVFAHTWFT